MFKTTAAAAAAAAEGGHDMIKKKFPLLKSESSCSTDSAFSSRRESLEEDAPVDAGKTTGPKAAPASLLLGSSPFSAMMSSEEDEASNASSSPMATTCSSVASSVPSSSVFGSSVESVASSLPAASTLAKQQRRRKKKKRLVESMSSSTFRDVYYTTGEVLGEGSYGRVETCVNMFTDIEYAVKVISKSNWCFSRSKVLKEIELYYLCQGQTEIIQLVEYFEEPDFFYLIFEKAYGGPLLDQIQRRVHFTEEEAVSIIRDLARALRFLHSRGIAHRDIKPENVLCIERNSPRVIKLCDFDLCSSVTQSLSTPLLQSPVGSAEYMAPEVVNAFSNLEYDYQDDDEDDELTYDKKCDLWSLGIIAYILLCGYLPFSGRCEEPASCAWESGGECLQCQRSLFNAIRTGSLVFPDQHWSGVSEDAKDLISRLLVKEAGRRLDAVGVLEHPWIARGGSAATVLETPRALRKQADELAAAAADGTTPAKKEAPSVPAAFAVGPTGAASIKGGAVSREFSDFASSALSIKRNFETNMSFSRAFQQQQRKMRRSATSQDFFSAAFAAATTLAPPAHAASFRKTSAHSFMGPEAAASPSSALNQTVPPAIVDKMRRQTSLIFPEEMNNNDRCEV